MPTENTSILSYSIDLGQLQVETANEIDIANEADEKTFCFVITNIHNLIQVYQLTCPWRPSHSDMHTLN